MKTTTMYYHREFEGVREQEAGEIGNRLLGFEHEDWEKVGQPSMAGWLCFWRGHTALLRHACHKQKPVGHV